jgi:hypothetical protein
MSIVKLKLHKNGLRPNRKHFIVMESWDLFVLGPDRTHWKAEW